jgi:RHS repeat-associated protein
MRKNIGALITTIIFLLISGISNGATDDAASQTLTDVGTVEAQTADPDATVSPQEATSDSTETAPSKGVDSSAQADQTSLSATASAAVLSGSENEDNIDISSLNFESMDVSQAGNTGAAFASIPIIVPPGRKGIEPKISLQYNSIFQNGWVGIGWKLDMGAIQRSKKRAVNYSADNYVLSVNGIVTELVTRTTEWGANYYGVKIEKDFSKYYYNSTTGGWVVTTKEGTTYYYGSTAASRQIENNNGGVFKWLLDKVKDTNGNYMTVTYQIDNGDIYLYEINYTGNDNTGIGTSNTVRFLRGNEVRTDAPVSFTSKSYVKTAYLLRTIDVLRNGSRVRAYKLTYTQSGATSRYLLSSVKQYGTDATICTDTSNGQCTYNTVTGGTALPALRYTYHPEGDGTFGNLVESNPATSGYGPPWSFSFADVNGDGRADAILNKIGDNTGARVKVALANANNEGQFDAFITTNLATTGYPPPWKFSFTDVNGDGRADAIASKIGDGTGAKVKVALANANNEGQFDAFITTDLATTGYSSPWSFSFKDVNGDGKADAIATSVGVVSLNGLGCASTDNIKVALSDGNGGFGSFNQSLSAGVCDGYTPSHFFTFADINGDGRVDVVLYDNLNVNVALSKNDGTFGSYKNTSRDGLWNLNLAFVDVNGDGMQDFVEYIIGGPIDFNGSGAHIRVGLSKGDGSFDALQATDFSESGYPEPWKFAFEDVNGDGMTDAIAYKIGDNPPCQFICPGNDAYVRVALSKGNGQFKAFKETNYYSTTQYLSPWKFAFADVNGDGRGDAIVYKIGDKFGNASDVIVRAAITSGDKNDKIGDNLLETISNRHGATTTLEYKPSSAYDNCFDVGGRDTCLSLVAQTLSRVTVNDGNGVISDTNYTYAYGYFDAPYREYRGFGYTKATVPDLTTSETWFHQDVFRKGLPYQSEVKEPSSGQLLSRTTLTWENPVGSPAWAFIKLNQKRTEIVENSVTTAYSQEGYTYDGTNGNLLSTVQSGTDAESITTATLYQNFGTWVWRPIQTTVTGSGSGKVRETYFGYQSVTGNLLYKEFWLSGGTNPKIETTLYDSYGNPKSIKDANGNITATDYDTLTNTYPVKITYPQTGTITHIVESSYNYKFGKPDWTKDENLKVKNYTYDKFGRVTQVDNPDSGQITTQYYDDTVPVYRVTKIKENASGQTVDKYTYFDGLARKIQTVTFGEAGKSIVTTTQYDNMRRVAVTKGPFFSTGTGYPKQPPSAYPWGQTVYDYRGRPTSVTSPSIEYSTVTTSYAYSGLSSTITDPDGKKKATKKDYLGRIIEVKEYGDNNAIYTTAYSYNAVGDLKTITDHNGNVTSINYDTLGRKINMQDPDMGYWIYTYDPNGNLKTQKDPKNQTITFNYDALNRMTGRTYSTSAPAVTYTYDNLSIPNGRGRLYSVSNTNVTTTYNSYDAMGRVKSSTKTIAGNSTQYTTLNDYDLSGKTTKTTYPDGFYVTKNFYPGTGLLEKVTGSDGIVYTLNTLYEPTGKMGQIDHQNGTKTRYGYDSWSTKLMSIVTTSPSSTGNPRYDVINRGYSYSRAGDINTITDYKKGAELGLANNIFNYQYTYDNLHRLAGETTTNNTYASSTFVYDPTGNIIAKVTGSNAMTYAYTDPLHKHAVKTITFNSVPYTYQYDANGNMTSGPDFTDIANISTRQQIVYNADNMPTQVTHSRYGVTNIVYDGESRRAKKVSPSGTTYYIGEHYEVINGVATKYIFAGNLRVAKVTASATNYYHKDHLGSSLAITNSSGAIVETTDYSPFGEQRGHTGTTVTGYKFTDQEWDMESGLYYYDARYYDPAIGRFISADTIVPNPGNPQDLNRYTYCSNNPIRMIDPNGHDDGDCGDSDGDGEGDCSDGDGDSDGTDADTGGDDTDVCTDVDTNTVTNAQKDATPEEVTAKDKDKDIDKALNTLKNTGWAKSTEGKEIVESLNKANNKEDIEIAELDVNTRAQYNPNSGRITINDNTFKNEIPGRLAHEGTHLTKDEQGLPYDFNNERAAYNNGYAVDKELGVSFPFNPSDAWIHENYDKSFNK